MNVLFQFWAGQNQKVLSESVNFSHATSIDAVNANPLI